MKGIYQIIGSDGVTLAAVATATEEEAKLAQAEYDDAGLLFVNDTTLESGELYELGNDEVGSLIVVAVENEAEALETAKVWGEEFGEVYNVKRVGSF